MKQAKYQEILFDSEIKNQWNKYHFLSSMDKSPKGLFYPMHYHDYYEIEVVMEGKIEYIYNGTVIEAERGTGFFITPFDSHSLKRLEDTVLLNIRFKNNLFDNEIKDIFDKHTNYLFCKFNDEELNTIISLYEELNYEKNSNAAYYEILIRNIIVKIVIMIIRNSDIDIILQKPHIVQKALILAQQHIFDNISLKTIAGELFVSPDYLGKQFKKHVGMKFTEYMNTLKLRNACSLLTTTDLSVSQIAENSGYNSPEHFMYVFKKYMQTTPNKYRKQSTKYNY